MHSKVKRFVLLVMACGFLVGSGFTLKPLQRMRARYDLTSAPVTGISPQLALATQVLGWGRGILIDILWIRMESLKSQDRYFELVQLADWACKLAPRFPKVWDFQAWNLAYNVSCRVDYLEDRWAWVLSGIELLRDSGIPENPNAWGLYESLSWIIFHKIGQQDDNAHFFYKQKFARMMHRVLGGGGERKVLESLVNAPKTREELVLDEKVKDVVDRASEMGYDIVEGLFDIQERASWVPEQVMKLAFDPANANTMAKIQAYARARELAKMNLDPAEMIKLMDTYGDFDWRSPYPHAIYWASIGLDRLEAFESRMYGTIEKLGMEEPLAHKAGEAEQYTEDERLYVWHEVNLTRLICVSLQSLVMHGRVIYDRYGRVMADMGTDYRFADQTLKAYEDAIGKFGRRFARGSEEGLQNFLARGIVEFYFMGQTAKSREYYAKLQSMYPEKTYGKGFDEYLEWRLNDFASSMTFSDARRLVRGYAWQYYLCIGCNQDDKAQVREGEAKAIAQHFNKDADSIREMIRYEQIKESILVDILSERMPLPPEVLANLKNRLNDMQPGIVERILARVKATETAPELEEEEVDEELKMESTAKPK